MSNTRRRLGTGPSTTSSSTPPVGPAPRLLPAERVEPGQLLDDVEHQAVADAKGRRTLGPGITTQQVVP
ncbi:hypothetical protein ACFU98_42465 [Streptomyces sp. NPDC057575]|uniref:hypothetical protein n=1 Tax=unclassified Streptomyces TaxID=2593676 RepID=UPI00369CB174